MEDELLIPCVGDRVGWRRVTTPPPLEIETTDGLLVLDGTDPVDRRYVFDRTDTPD